MKQHHTLRHATVALLALASITSARCGGSSDVSATGGGSASQAAAGTPAAGAKSSASTAAPGAAGPSVLGERLTPRVVQDQIQKLPVGVVAVPAGWKYDANVTWNYGWVSNPVNYSSRAENPANEEAVYGFGNAEFFDLRPVLVPIRQGQNQGGLIYGHPMAPLQTLAMFVQDKRGREAGFTFVGGKQLPELPAALNMPASPNQQGVGVKVAYTLNGKPVEEEFYAVGYQIEIPYDGPQGRTYQINWGLVSVHSFRAAAGTLDARRPLFAAIAKSFRPNPVWQQRVAAINKYLADEFNRQLQAGYDQIAAAARLSQQISANNDAMLRTIDSQLAASRTSSGSGGSSAGTSSAAKFDDYINGVTTVDDPYYGTSRQANDTSFHWTDGYGNYRNSNDVTYDPNRTEVGSWTPMKAIR
jgi:hypothetical protein